MIASASPLERFADPQACYESYGVKANTLAPEDLFDRYRQAGFLYPAKLERLQPYLPLIMENWRRSMSAPLERSLHHVLLREHPQTGCWATVSFWRSGACNTHSQHLVGTGIALGSQSVLLAGQVSLWLMKLQSIQNWYRAENRFPARVFGSAPDALGPDSACLQSRVIIALGRDRLPEPSADVDAASLSTADGPFAANLHARWNDPVACAAEELAGGDLLWDSLDAAWREVGLRRWRRVFAAIDLATHQPIGMAIATRGPLGLNFSFLENRCDLWIEPSLEAAKREAAVRALLHAAAETYRDFELPCMVIACDEPVAALLESHGGKVMQRYQRCVWLRSGFGAWHRHVDSFYQRVREMEQRRATRRAATASPSDSRAAAS